MKLISLIFLILLVSESYASDETGQWCFYENPLFYISEKLTNDSYAGLKCGLSLYSYTLGLLSLPDSKPEISINTNNASMLNLPVCFPEEKDWLLSGLKEVYERVRSLLTDEVSTVLSGATTLVLIKYAKSPYGGPTIYEMIKSSLSFEDFLNKLWMMPAPSFLDATLGGVYEEFVFRLLIQYGLFLLARIGLGYFYEDSELIESHSNIFSISIASISFGLIHLLNPNPQIAQAFMATLAGVYLGSTFVDNGIIASSICHSVFNGSILLLRTTILNLLFTIPRIITWYSYYSLPYPIQETGDSGNSIRVP